MDGLHRGGKERRFLQLLRYLTERNLADIEVAFMSRESAYPEFHDLKIRTHYLVRKTTKDLRVFPAFYHLCREFQPTIIHTWDSMTTVYALPVAKLLSAKLVNGMITDAPQKISRWSEKSLWTRITFPFSDVIVANSLAGLHAYNAPSSRSVCIYSGFDRRRTIGLQDPEAIRKELGVRTSKVVGMVGKFAERKDFTTFVLAAQEVCRTFDDVTFLAIGGGPTLDTIKGLVASVNKQRVLFPGWQTAIESIVNIFDIGVLSSFSEGASNSILEYMALSKPVIATDAGGTSEIVVDKMTGLLVPSRDVDALAAAILSLLTKPEDARAMGIQGGARLAEVFSIEAMGSRYWKLYSHL